MVVNVKAYFVQAEFVGLYQQQMDYQLVSHQVFKFCVMKKISFKIIIVVLTIAFFIKCDFVHNANPVLEPSACGRDVT